MKQVSVFYSWQSGPYDREYRYFIGDCLKKASKTLEKDGLKVVIEQDTRGSSGAADIPQTLFSKIENADVFVADISIINPDSVQERKTPNPNVMVELGYAAGKLSWERILLVFNRKSGTTKDLPFDVRHRRIVDYDTSGDAAGVKKQLTAKLTGAIRSVLTKPTETKERVKTSLSGLIMDAFRYTWVSETTSDDEPEPVSKILMGPVVQKPVVLDFHLQQTSLLQFELAEDEFAMLTDILDICKKMRSDTEEACEGEYDRQLAAGYFEPVWREYCEDLERLPMEKCLQRKTVQLLNRLLPEDRKIVYEDWRKTDDGKKVFFSNGRHLEAYDPDGELLINADLDDLGRVTGWKKERDYQGYFVEGRRHGKGVEYSLNIHHIGEERLDGRWEEGHFVEGILHGAVLCRDDTAEDGFSFLDDTEELPLLLCDVGTEFLLKHAAPDECEDLYLSDLLLHEGEFDIRGAPTPLCPRKRDGQNQACYFCPKEYGE